jgi:hypothetical protein
VGSDVGGVSKRGSNLIDRQTIQGGRGIDTFALRNLGDDCRDVHARASDARLPKPHIRVHRDAWKDFHQPLRMVGYYHSLGG